MKTILLLFLFTLSYPIQKKNQETVLLRKEAILAFEYLNKLRQNPQLIYSETGIKDKNIKKTHALNWNDTLAIVARNKAADMATRNYFSHTNKKGQGINILIHNAGYKLNYAFIEKKNNNFFESIFAGSSDPKDIIRNLIIDKGVNPPGHRHHLLGMTDFYKNCFDCGIGIAYNPNSKYKYYTCIIIAKRDF